jgi:Uma2 family endonuclease
MPLTQPYSPHTPSTMRTSRGEVRVPERMALADFEKLEWEKTERWELIEGVPCMTPSGTFEHQHLSGILFSYLMGQLGSAGYFVVQDVDVRFPRQKSYLRPDLSVFAPDMPPAEGVVPIRQLPVLVVEILSSSTASNDLGPKLDIFGRAKVSEYWVVDPKTGGTMLFVSQDAGGLSQQSSDSEGRVFSPLLGRSFRILRKGLTFKVVE